MVSSYLFKDFMLIFYQQQFFFRVIFSNFDDFQGVDVFGLLSPGHVDFAKGTLPQELQDLEIYVDK